MKKEKEHKNPKKLMTNLIDDVLRPVWNTCTTGIMPTVIITLAIGTILLVILWNL